MGWLVTMVPNQNPREQLALDTINYRTRGGAHQVRQGGYRKFNNYATGLLLENGKPHSVFVSRPSIGRLGDDQHSFLRVARVCEAMEN